MTKIRVGFYVHEWTYAGTARAHEWLLSAIDMRVFEPFVIYWDGGQNDRLPYLLKAIGENHMVPFSRSQGRKGVGDLYVPEWTDFDKVVGGLDLHVLHHARGGYPEWPLSTSRNAIVQVETNIFGDVDSSPFLDRSVAICHHIDQRRGCSRDGVLYNPIPRPDWTTHDGEETPRTLRKELGIPDDAVVCGRIGRPGNFHPIAIEGFKKARAVRDDLYYVVIGACADFQRAAADTPGVITLPVTNDDSRIASFYRTLDLFCHYRADGECHSTAIAQAMRYGVPVISHEGSPFRGNVETIGPGGRICTTADEYYAAIMELSYASERRAVGREAVEHSMLFDQTLIAYRWAHRYQEWVRGAV